MKNNKQKQALLEQLKKTPITQIACERTGIGRTTYYRWRKENPNFAKRADEAIAQGEALITDMTESQLISLIKDRNFPAIQLWLRHHHPKYGNKIELAGDINIKNEPLTPAQQEIIRQALELAGIGDETDRNKNE